MTEEQKIVYEGLMSFYEAHKEGNFSSREMIAHMEPVFKKEITV